MVDPPRPVTVIYKTAKDNAGEEVDIPLDLYVPSNAAQRTAAAIPLIWIHTGGFLQGTRKMTPGHLLRSVNKHNFAVIAPDFRLAPQVTLAEVLEDIHDCIHFVLSGKLSAAATATNIDTTQYVLAGSSAGGWSSLLLGLNLIPALPVPTPAALVSIYPITTVSKSLAPYFHTPLRPLPWAYSAAAKKGDVVPGEPLREHIDKGGLVRTEASLALQPVRSTLYTYARQEGTYPEMILAKGQDVEEYSTPALITARIAQETTVPRVVFIAYGDADVMVETSQSTMVIDALKQTTNVNLVTHVEAGQGHVWDILQQDAEIPGLWESVTQALATA
ncbi:hypothetical protein CBS101457_000106 [Exobasidium rhododendri]|nr:hypothetical protein CBS101457_000106 [Exobasidium rhododendri]